jgi:hypothetical protein
MGKNVMVGAAVLSVAALMAACGGGGTPAEQYCEEAVIETEPVAAILLLPPSSGGGVRSAPAPAPSRPSASSSSKPSTPAARSNAGAKQANLSRAPAPSRISTPKYQRYDSHHFQTNNWMWFYFAFHVDDNESPEEGEFEAWLNGQSDEDLHAAEEQYHEERC